jgi:hypothetical protein
MPTLLRFERKRMNMVVTGPIRTSTSSTSWLDEPPPRANSRVVKQIAGERAAAFA